MNLPAYQPHCTYTCCCPSYLELWIISWDQIGVVKLVFFFLQFWLTSIGANCVQVFVQAAVPKLMKYDKKENSNNKKPLWMSGTAGWINGDCSTTWLLQPLMKSQYTWVWSSLKEKSCTLVSSSLPCDWTIKQEVVVVEIRLIGSDASSGFFFFFLTWLLLDLKCVDWTDNSKD